MMYVQCSCSIKFQKVQNLDFTRMVITKYTCFNVT
jgi:hypothetical protein